MISQEISNLIISTLINETDKLSDISANFNQLTFGDRISSYTAISLLLTNSLLDHKQQVIAIWLLFNDPQVDNIKDHPYYQVLTFIYKNSLNEPNLYSPQLQELIKYLLIGVSIDFLGSHNINNIFSSDFVFPHSDCLNTIESGLILLEARNSNKAITDDKIPSMLIMKNNEESTDCKIKDYNKLLFEILQEEAFWKDFDTPLLIPSPEVSPIFEGEIEAIQSYDNPPFIFDEGVTVDSREAAIALARKSTETKLRSGESNSLVKKLQDDSSYIKEIPITSLKFLIENNKEVAKEVIKYYALQHDKKQKSEYDKTISEILLNIELTASSIDVITSYIISGYASEDFLDKYIHHTTQAILKIRDNQTMFRKARLFCRMMSYIIQNNINLNNIMILNLNSFCQDNRTKSIKEAEDLNQKLLA